MSYQFKKIIVINASLPEYTLKKIHGSIPYHAFRWSATVMDIRVLFEVGKYHLEDILKNN